MNKWLKYSLLVILAIIWGSSFFMMKEGLLSLSPLQVASLRIFSAGLFLFPFALTHLKKIAKEDVKYAVLSGFIGNGIPAILFAFAQTKVLSSLSGSLNSLTPLFAMLFSVLVFGIGVSRRQMFGVLIGLGGALFLILGGPQEEGESNYLYTIPIIIATMLYGLNVNLIKSKLSKYHPLVVTSIPLTSVSIFAFFLLLYTGIPSWQDLQDPQVLRSVSAIVILGIIGTALALILFNRLLQVSSPVFAASVTYLIPGVAVIIGFFDKEPILWGQIVGLTLILLGVSLVNKRKSS